MVPPVVWRKEPPLVGPEGRRPEPPEEIPDEAASDRGVDGVADEPPLLLERHGLRQGPAGRVAQQREHLLRGEVPQAAHLLGRQAREAVPLALVRREAAGLREQQRARLPEALAGQRLLAVVRGERLRARRGARGHVELAGGAAGHEVRGRPQRLIPVARGGRGVAEVPHGPRLSAGPAGRIARAARHGRDVEALARAREAEAGGVQHPGLGVGRPPGWPRRERNVEGTNEDSC